MKVHNYIIVLFLVYINVKENTTSAEHANLLKQYIAWNFDQHQKKNPEQMCVVLMDMSGAGVGNVVRTTFCLSNTVGVVFLV